MSALVKTQACRLIVRLTIVLFPEAICFLCLSALKLNFFAGFYWRWPIKPVQNPTWSPHQRIQSGNLALYRRVGGANLEPFPREERPFR